MKRHSLIGLLVIAVLPITMIGCGNSAKDKLVGKWKASSELNEQAVQQMFQDAGNDPLKVQIASATIQAYRATTMDIEFKRDGTMISQGEIGQIAGIWQVVQEQGNKVTIVTEEGDKGAQEIELSLENKNSFYVELAGPVANFGVMRFKRIR